jgi:hypothetical protein
MAARKRTGTSKRSRSSKKNIFSRGISTIRKTSKKIIPGVKTGIETVGNKVVPKTKSAMKGIFGFFRFGKTKKHRKSRKH